MIHCPSRFRRSLGLLLLAFASTSGARVAEPGRLAQVDEEERVWAAVLATFVEEGTQQLVVFDSTLAIPGRVVEWQEVPGRLPDAGREVIRSFVRVNGTSRFLPDFSGLGLPVIRVRDADLAPIREAAGNPTEYWEAFYAAYPDSPGLIRLSRVGVDPSREQALVWVTHQCGGRCGTGSYLLLSKANGSWVVTARSVVTMS
jgi:hypothetical protein